MSRKQPPATPSPRLGKALAVARAATEQRTQAKAAAAAARTPKPRWAEPTDAPSVKVTVTFQQQQVIWLDRLALDIRAASGVTVARSELLQSIVAAVADAGLDLATATSDAGLRSLLVSRLTGK